MLRQALERAPKRRKPEPRRGDQRGVREDVGRRTVGEDAAPGEHDRAVRVLGHELHVVRHHEDGRAFAVQLAQQPEQLVGAGAVLAEGRLIEGEHRCSRDEGGADRESSLLPAGQEEWMGLRLGGESEALEHLLGALADLRVGQVAQTQAMRQFVVHGVRDELVLGVLEDEADA